MSIANLLQPNQFQLYGYFNPPSVELAPLLGDCTFLGNATAIAPADYRVTASQIGNIVNLDISIPSTVATATEAITFENNDSIPPNLCPQDEPVVFQCYCQNIDDDNNSKTAYVQITTAGTLSIQLLGAATNAEHYIFKQVVSYSLSQ